MLRRENEILKREIACIADIERPRHENNIYRYAYLAKSAYRAVAGATRVPSTQP